MWLYGGESPGFRFVRRAKREAEGRVSLAIGNLPLLPDFLIQQAAGMFAYFAPRLRPSPYTAFQQCKGFGFGNENISESCCNYI